MQPSSADAPGNDRVIAWAFVLVQLVLIAIVVVLPSGNAWTAPAWLSVAARALSFMGLLVIGMGLVTLGRSATPLPTPVKDGELRSSGLYAYVRHPIYTGVMAFAIGAAIPSGNVGAAAAAAALVVWLAIKARWEERRLRGRYPGYAAYAGRTPRFIPTWRRLR